MMRTLTREQLNHTPSVAMVGSVISQHFLGLCSPPMEYVTIAVDMVGQYLGLHSPAMESVSIAVSMVGTYLGLHSQAMEYCSKHGRKISGPVFSNYGICKCCSKHGRKNIWACILKLWNLSILVNMEEKYLQFEEP